MTQGKIDFINHQGRYGFIQTTDGQRVHFRFATLQKPARWEDLHEGLEVTLETIQGEKGPTAKWVQIGSGNGQEEQPGESSRKVWPPPRGYRFLNPYNFVRYLEYKGKDGDGASREIQLMGRCPPPPHDRWLGISGRIRCRVTVKTPLFISGGKPKEVDKNKHPTFEFVKKNGEKYLPASSLRGPVRSVFEAVTNSCFATLTDKRLSYRLDPSLAGFLVPARLEHMNESWHLRLLTGTAELSLHEKPRELYPASVHLYQPLRSNSKNPHAKPPPCVELRPLLETGEDYEGKSQFHNRVCFAVLLRLKFPPSWRVVAVAKTKEEAQRWINEHQKEFGTALKIANGVLCITNQNIDNKASERFFFLGSRSVVLRLEKGRGLEVLAKYQDLLTDYYENHKKEVEERRKNGKDPSQPLDKEHPGFSRFILEPPVQKDAWESEHNGDVVYAYLEGRSPQDARLLFLAPVSIPRVAYDHTIGDLLPESLHRCTDGDHQCPACRAFGWVRAEGGGRSQAYRGRVRFSDGKHETKKAYPRSLTLSILGSPKPTTTRFYLAGPDGRPQFGRSDSAAGYDGNEGNNRLRGRKFYRHHKPEMPFLLAPTNKEGTGPEKSNQNRTITDAEDTGATFTFSVRFENLAPEELGALLWSLEMGGKGYHRLGYGKPLGLGSVAIDAYQVEKFDPLLRCETLEANAGWQDVTGQKDSWVRAFYRAMTRRYAPGAANRIDQPESAEWEKVFLALPNLVDLLAIVGKAEPGLPVHYPRASAGPDETKGSFEWFMGNKRKNGPKLELDLPAEDKGLPLINKRGDVWK